jgi:hypothetical protein
MYRWWFNKYSLATLYCLWFRSNKNLVFIIISSGICTCTAFIYMWILFKIYEMWTSLRSTLCKFISKNFEWIGSFRILVYLLISLILFYFNRKNVQSFILQQMKSIIKMIYLYLKLMEILIEYIVKIYVYLQNYFLIIKLFIMMLNHFYSMF